ncbi:MAG: PilZ domain-containing protein [Rhodospirillales bacterium]
MPISSFSVVGQANANHRRNHRVSEPELRMIVDGEFYQACDWGLGGFSLQAPGALFQAGQEVLLWSVGVRGFADIRVNARAVVVRADSDGSIACRFLALSDRAFSVLEGLMLNRPRFRQTSGGSRGGSSAVA